MQNDFKIQLPNEVIRNPDITPLSFVVYAKLIHMYNYNGRKKELELNCYNFMHYLNIKENRTLKKVLKILYEKELILNNIKRLNEKIILILNEDKIISKNVIVPFTQLSSKLFNKEMINRIGLPGCKLLYYYRSYINYTTGKPFCYTNEETISLEVGLDEKTIRKYNNILLDQKLLKIDKHELSTNNEYIKKNGIDVLFFTKYNNHYYVLENNIHKIK